GAAPAPCGPRRRRRAGVGAARPRPRARRAAGVARRRHPRRARRAPRRRAADRVRVLHPPQQPRPLGRDRGDGRATGRGARRGGGSPFAVLVALRPALALLAPLAVAGWGALAVRRDRRDPSATRWNELRHGVAGDPGWLGGTDG